MFTFTMPKKTAVESVGSSERYRTQLTYLFKIYLAIQVGNKSSEYQDDGEHVRKDGSFIYEQFLESTNSEDVKVYTIGDEFAHAETRKSPVVDGVVRRNAEGKEIRYVTPLTDEETNIAKIVSKTFGQSICGFDLLRTEGKSYVIDVNGWSFVKGNPYYYDRCAQVLRSMFLEAAKKKDKITNHQSQANIENQWKLKGFFSVMRHGDRTPKQKMKFYFKSKPFLDLLNGATEEVVIKKQENLQKVLIACQEAAGLEDPTFLEQLQMILEAKSAFPGTKVQIKPSFNKTDNTLEKVQCIVKWGGEFTYDFIAMNFRLSHSS
jgi:inositol hexakisphosphate/diphosphoinositol-pentakisphosphate kinase